MKKQFIKILTAALLFFLIASPSFSQSVNVPLNHWAYDFLDRMETKGCFRSLLLRSRPISRQDVADMLSEIEHRYSERQVKLSKAELELFEQLKGEFHEELDRLSVGSQQKLHERHLITWQEQDDNVKIDLELSQRFNIFRGDQFDSTKRTSRTSLGGIIRGNFKNSLGLYISFMNTLVRGENIERENFDPEFGMPVTIAGANVFSDNASAYLVFRWPWFNMELGRDKAQWGPGIRGSLMLSDNNTYFDMLKLRMTYKRFQFTSIHGKLSSSKGAKFLAAHRLELRVFPWLMVAGSELVIYGDRDIEPAYLNPFMPYHVAEHHLGDKDNNTMGFEVTAFPFKNNKFYFELFLDDFTSSENPFTYFGSKFAFLTGWRWVDPVGLNSTDFQVEYARVEPFVYTHTKAINVYKNYDRPIGHWLGPNADDLYIKTSYLPNRDLKIAMVIERTRHGEGSIDTPHESSMGTQKKFLSGVVETTWSYGIEVRDQIFRDCFITLNYYYLDINNLNRIQNNHSRDNQVKLSLLLNY